MDTDKREVSLRARLLQSGPIVPNRGRNRSRLRMPESPLATSTNLSEPCFSSKVPCTANRVQNVRESEANNSQYCFTRLLWEDRQTADSSLSRLSICVHRFPSASQL